MTRFLNLFTWYATTSTALGAVFVGFTQCGGYAFHERVLAAHTFVCAAFMIVMSLRRMQLALIVALDQFPRSVWRGTSKAYENDPRALALTLEGLDNGHFDVLRTVWEKAFFQMPLVHCECSDIIANAERAVEIGRRLLAEAPDHLRPIYEFCARQPIEALKVLRAFGRHPHRNGVLGRESTAAEKAYLEKGQFPHERSPDWSAWPND